jgi:hypothetical protein
MCPSGTTPFNDDTPELIMRNILHSQIPWSLLPAQPEEERASGTPTSTVFIAALLRRDPISRLGTLCEIECDVRCAMWWPMRVCD